MTSAEIAEAVHLHPELAAAVRAVALASDLERPRVLQNEALRHACSAIAKPDADVLFNAAITHAA